jgi:hypothetical protein
MTALPEGGKGMWWQTLALRDAVATDIAGTTHCKHLRKFKLIRPGTAKGQPIAPKTWFTSRPGTANQDNFPASVTTSFNDKLSHCLNWIFIFLFYGIHSP